MRTMKIYYCLFAVLCLSSTFFFSRQFTDLYIVPKWCFGLLVLFMASIYEAAIILFSKRDKQTRIAVSVYGYIIVTSCLLQAVFGIVQFFGLFQTSSAFKVIGGFDNPAGFAACLCAGFPFIGFLLLNSNKYIRYGGWAVGLIITVAVILSQSRAGIVSIAFICFILLNMKLFHKRWMRYLYLICFALLLAGCYWLKKDSADGRLLIWKCSMNMVKDAPWMGHGIGSFEATYMDYQANYFEQHEQSRYSTLAGNVKNPFNEYIGVLLNFGIVGLLIISAVILLLICCYKKHPSTEKRIALYSLLSIGIFSLFSYPFIYPFTWIVSFFCMVILTKEYMAEFLVRTMIKKTICMLVLSCSIVGIYKLAERVKAEKEWGAVSKLALSGAFGETLAAYEKLKNKFEDNPYFLYNYAAILFENKRYGESLNIALQCRRYWADYDLELIIGENYQNLDKHELAKRYYGSASLMCPSRFLPLYKLFHLYKDIDDRECMLSIAKQIITKPMKITTSTIRMMKREMEREQERLLTEENCELGHCINQ